MAPHGRDWEAPLREIDGVSTAYESVLLKMLNPVNSRYQGMQDVVRDVKALQSGAPPPLASADDLDDEAALLLGAIYEEWAPDRSPVLVTAIQQSTASALSRMGFGIARDTLQDRGLVSDTEWENEWGALFSAFELTDLGKVWVKKNRARIEALIGKMREETVDDDIPF
jgi:hypothetical protein